MRSTSAKAAFLLPFALFVCNSLAAQAFRETPARPATAASQPTATPKTFDSPEQHTTRAFEAARNNDGALYAFLKEMPKGGDLHNHITGSAYAETYIQYAAQDGLCVDTKTYVLSDAPCKDSQVEAKRALSDPALYGAMIDAWSMRNFVATTTSGHDHFFDTFSKFGAASHRHLGDIMADLSIRNSDGHVQYLELMTMPDNSASIGFGSKFTFTPDLATLRKQMLAGGMAELVAASRKNLDEWDARSAEVLHCKDRNPNVVNDACNSVEIRHVYAVLRAFAPEQVFAQLLLAFELANQDHRVVGINMVQPEDWLIPMRDYTMHMKMVSFLRELYPGVHIALHAGEIAPGRVTPEGLRYHIREAVEIAHAERIGHGVDVMYEENPQQLLSEMSKRNVMVEICLTSNDGILGIKGRAHPLQMYMKAGVPVALATDDEGVSRSEMTREYMKAVQEQGLDYQELKNMARTSLEHSFLPGNGMWSDARKFVPARVCERERAEKQNPTGNCAKFLAENEKARAEFKLEQSFSAFESSF